MIPIEIRNGVRLLRAQGQSLREISRLLKLSRNAVRCILREKDGARAITALRCRNLGQARGGLQARAWQWGARAGTLGHRGWIGSALQHADTVDQGSAVA